MTPATLPVDGYGEEIGDIIDLHALDKVMRRPLSELGASPLRTLEDAIAATLVALAAHYGRLPTSADFHSSFEIGRERTWLTVTTTDDHSYHADFDTDTVPLLRDMFGVLPN